MSSQPWDFIAKLVCIGDSGTGKSSLTNRLCEGRFTPQHDVTIGVEFGSRIVDVGPPASLSLNINNPQSSKPSANPPTPSSLHSKAPPTTKTSSSSKPPSSSPSSRPSQKRMKLSLWDTAGQETYKSITRSYFRGASGALLVFDITRRATFDSVTTWLRDLRAIAEDNIVIILVGNKSDLANPSLIPTSPYPHPPNNAGKNSSSSSNDAGETHNRRAVTADEASEWCARNDVLLYVETSAKSGEGVERAFLEVAERIYQNIEAGRYDLNDRRSGVKGPGINTVAGGSGRGGGAGGRAVVLGPEREKGGCC